jgi:protein-tyrosine phosphatase
VSTSAVRVCFVCSGNICRSPAAEVVFRGLVEDARMADRFVLASAGTGDWHRGDDMDDRARAALINRGHRPGEHRAAQFRVEDFGSYDLVVCLDAGHLSRLSQLARQADEVDEALAALVLLRSYDPSAGPSELDVPDPYYGGAAEFDEVVAMVERACAGLLASIAATL